MRSDYLAKAAEYLGVTTDYLLGLDTQITKNTAPISELAVLCNRLTEIQQAEVKGYIKRMLEEEIGKQLSQKGA